MIISNDNKWVLILQLLGNVTLSAGGLYLAWGHTVSEGQ